MSRRINELIKSCEKGEQRAQIKIYDLYCEAMYSIACRYLKNDEDAKDAMQEGFLKAFTKINTYKNTYSFGSWLKRIIINQCFDFLKRKQLDLVSIVDYDLVLIEDNDDWEIDSDISKETVLNKMDMLSHKYQAALKLYLIEGYDHQEISMILSIPEKTSRTHVRRGKLHLKELLLKEKRNETRS